MKKNKLAFDIDFQGKFIKKTPFKYLFGYAF